MDPKKISSLDPKLRETYERIMGTSPQSAVPTQTPASATAQVVAPVKQTPEEPAQKPAGQPQVLQIPINQPAEKPISGFMQPPQPETQQLTKPKEELPALPPIMETQTIQESPLSQNLNMSAPQEDFTKSPISAPNNPLINSNGAIVNQTENQPQKQKKKNKLLPVLLITGAIIFFVVYAVIWAKLFNLF